MSRSQWRFLSLFLSFFLFLSLLSLSLPTRIGCRASCINSDGSTLSAPQFSSLNLSSEPSQRGRDLHTYSHTQAYKSCNMGDKSKVLIFGATGYIGKHIARASVAEGHPTSIFIRPSTLVSKAELLESFKALGITFVEGSLDDHAGLVAAIKEVDVVISALGGPAIPEQEKIIAAIKEAGNVKRFLPSEFGNDVDHAKALEPVNTMYGKKVAIRRKVEAAGIPYTYISSNAFAGYTLANLVQFGKPAPPRDKVVIYGTGDVKAIFVKEEDIGTYTVKAIDDPRTLNKVVYLRPPANILSVNEVVALWEEKTGITLEKEYISEQDLVEQIKTSPIPKNIVLGTVHNIFVKGDQTNFEIGEKNGVEASELYPEVKYTTASQYLDKYV